MPTLNLPKLPPIQEFEASPILRALIQAHKHLAELKGVAKSIPNEGILISTLSLQEAQSSSEIENVITTQDALHKEVLQTSISDPVAKKVDSEKRLEQYLKITKRVKLCLSHHPPNAYRNICQTLSISSTLNSL